MSQWLQATRAKYGIDPVIFLILMTACAPFFYYSIYRLVRAIAAKRKAQINVWSMVFLLSTILPYLYVLFFGRNMPWWVYAVVVALMAQGAYTLVVRRQGKSGPGSKGTP
ncbi:MAG TPA: hypothetical protein VMF29_01355 [Candidatus Edwardsbacteria bacterium]|nr:hypothetical protein [Candidatus Edwardsbacteria bacterium]